MKSIPRLFVFAAFVSFAVQSYSQRVPIEAYDEALRYRVNGQRGTDNAGVDFLSAAIWTQYRAHYEGGGANDEDWFDMPSENTVLPWDLPYFNDPSNPRIISVKMDGSTANINSALTQANLAITGLYNSTLNVNANVDIGGALGADGGMVVNIAAGVSFKAGANINTGGMFAGTTRGLISVIGTETSQSSLISAADIIAANGGDLVAKHTYVEAQRLEVQAGGTATFENVEMNLLASGNGAYLRVQGNSTSSGTLTITNSTINGRVYADAYGVLNAKDSVINAADGWLDVNKGAKIEYDGVTATYSNGGVSLSNSIDTADASDLETGLTLKNGTTLWVSGNLSLGANNSVGGDSVLKIEGEGNTLSVNNFESPSAGRIAGDSIVHITGNNNLFEVRTGNINIDGYISTAGSVIAGGSRGVKIEGEGNTFTAAQRLHIGRNDGAENGTFLAGGAFFKISSSNADNRALMAAPAINLGLAYTTTPDSSTYTTEFEMGGNVTLAKNADGTGDVELRVGSSSGGDSIRPNAGTAKFTMKNNNNIANLSRFEVAQIGYMGGGNAIVDISGDNNTVNLTNSDGLLIMSADNITGGKADFKFAGSNSAINVNSGNGIRIMTGNNISGGTVNFTMSGTGNTLNIVGDQGLRIMNSQVSGGTVNMKIEGDEHEILIQGTEGLRIMDAHVTGGTANFVFAAKNSSLTIDALGGANGIRTMGSSDGISGGDANIVFEGESNTITVKNNAGNAGVAIRTGNNASGGNSSLILRGTGNTLNIEGELNIGNADNATGGEGVFRISGTGNTLNVGSLKLGTGMSTDTYGRFIVDGGGNFIKVSGGLQGWQTDGFGGFFEFLVKNSGISTVDFLNSQSINIGFNMILDFTSLTHAMDSEMLTFIQSTGGTVSITRTLTKIIFSDGTEVYLEDGVNVYGNEKEGFTIVEEGDKFAIIYHNYIVPEPSAYAAVLGALSIAFAAYRRRKRKAM